VANSEVNKETSTKVEISSEISMRGVGPPVQLSYRPGDQGAYYLNCKKWQAQSSIAFKGSEQKTRIRAACVFAIVVLARGVTSGPKVHNPGGLKVHTSTSWY
jgi:hypothetical protein